MKILHYALGFPPYRSGGLTKFCVDLMVQQAKEGHEVTMVWPGQIGFFKKKTYIKRHELRVLNGYNIFNFEIINPLPVSLDEGISDITAFTKDTDKEVYKQFLSELKPDVIHVQTLMGLHKSFLDAAKELSIRLVFTAHDFFPICPKVTLFRNGKHCNSLQSCEDCGACNITALSIRKIKILQSPIYRAIKDIKLVKKLRKRHRDNYLNELKINNINKSVALVADYKKLRNYYYSLLKMMDVIHYNSSVTKRIYEKVFKLPCNCIISITHSDIKDNRISKEYINNEFRIRYLGPQGSAKGYFLLKSALDDLWSKQQNFCLDIHFIPKKIAPYMRIHDRYSYIELKDIFAQTDILVAPSLCYETFGFTVLEALSYGVPVIISDNVGAKDILIKNSGIIIHNINSNKLSNIIKNINNEKLKAMNKNIVEHQSIMQIDDMSEQIEKKCYCW